MLIITFMVWGIGLFSAGKEYLSKKNFLDDLKGGNFSTAVGYITEIENDISVDNYSFKFEPLEGKNLDFTIKDKDAWRYIHADENLQQIVYTGDKIHFVDYFTLSEYESLSYSQVKQYISEKFIKEILSNKLTTDSFTESENYNRSEVTVAIGILFFLLGFYFLISNIRDERIIKKRLAQLDRANQQNNN